MCGKFTLAVSALLLAALPAAGLAQQRDHESLRDSLTRSSSVAELRQREVALAKGPQSTESDVLIERGLLLLRLFELTKDNDDADDARNAFEEAVERAPTDGYAHYGLGLALAGGPNVRVPSPLGALDGIVIGQSIAEVIGQDPLSRAGRQFIKALDFDPTLTRAAVELANISLATRKPDTLKKSRDALKKVVEAGRSTSEITLALSRVQSALGDAAGAESSAGALTRDATASALRARAEALLRQPGKQDAGAAAYFDGVDKLDAASALEYFIDVRTVATEPELAGWEPAGLDARKTWLRHFWDLRAASSGKTVGERMGEHYRRVAEAQTRYRRQGRRGATPGGSLLQEKYQADQLPFDERGLIYVRHGDPVNVIKTANVDLRPNETWVYQLPSGRTQLFHFVVLRDGTDFRLVDDVLHAMDASTQGLPIDGIVKLLEDRAPYDGRYNILAARFNQIRNQRWAASAVASFCQAQGGTNCMGGNSEAGALAGESAGMLQTIANTRQSISVENREAAFNALASDSDRPVFETALPFYYDVYTFKGTSARQTDVTAAIAVPGTSLEPRPVSGSFIYALKLSLIVIDTVDGRVSRRDTTYQFRSDHTLGANEHLRVHAELSAAASKSTIHRIVLRDLNQTGRGQMYGGGTTVPAYDAPALMLSDIVLAEPDSGTWHRGDAHLALVPPRQFSEGQPLSLFYEIYKLPEDAAYRTEIVLAPTAGESGFTRLKKLFGGGSGSVRLQFDGIAKVDRNGNVQELRRVGNEMKPGKYRVQVRVTDLGSQRTAVTETQFVVIEKRK